MAGAKLRDDRCNAGCRGIVGVPANTVKTRMFYARKRMENLLETAGVGRQ
jgi:hypothetical protein